MRRCRGDRPRHKKPGQGKAETSEIPQGSPITDRTADGRQDAALYRHVSFETMLGLARTITDELLDIIATIPAKACRQSGARRGAADSDRHAGRPIKTPESRT